MLPEPLYYEDMVFALPSFRAIAFIDSEISNAAMRKAALEIYDLFLGASSSDLAFGARSGGKIKSLKPEPISPELITDFRNWLERDAFAYPSTLRFNAWPGAPLNVVTPPHLRIEQRAQYTLIQIELPPEHDRILPLSDQLTRILSGLPVLFAVMGMGFYLPSAKESLISQLPRSYPRYRAALEIQPDFIEDGLRRDEGMVFYRRHPDLLPGIPDIGWRTFIGAEYLDRLPGLEDALAGSGVTMNRNSLMAILTIGPKPIWGDVNRAEDISAYRKLSNALAAIRVRQPYLHNWLFGSNSDDFDAKDRLGAWYARFSHG